MTDLLERFDLDDLLSDGQSALKNYGLTTLSRAVGIARQHLQTFSISSAPTSPLTGERVAIRKEGARAWWQLPVDQRDVVIGILRLALTRTNEESQENENIEEEDEAVRSAIELLVTDWRTSLLTQIATLRATASPDEDRILARAQAALEFPSRPVFEADAQHGVVPPGIEEPCSVCGAKAGDFCDPTKHHEEPGDG